MSTRIKDIISDSMVIKEQIKTHLKLNNNSKKQLKTPCQVHNGHLEWDDCCKNPKNIRNNKNGQANKDNRDNHDSRDRREHGNGISGQSQEEQ